MHVWDYWFTKEPDEVDRYITHCYKCSQLCGKVTTRVQWWPMEVCPHDAGWVPDPLSEGSWMMCMRCLRTAPTDEENQRHAEDYIENLFNSTCGEGEIHGAPFREEPDTSRVSRSTDS